MLRGPLVSSLLSLLLAACAGVHAGAGGVQDAGPVACPAELSFRPATPGVRVFVSGAWNGFSADAEPLTDDGTGTYRRSLSLLPGEYAYRFRVDGDAEAPWQLDPLNPWRASWEGAELSGLRVEDCRRPSLEVLSSRVDGPGGSFHVQLRYVPRAAGSLATVTGEVRHAGASRPLGASELSVDGERISVALDFLARGKHVVTLSAQSSSGAISEEMRLPLWSEPEPFSWDGALLYMAVTDRFRNADPSNDAPPTDASPGAGWLGGDLDGVRAALEDGTLEALGVGALWLTPFAQGPAGTEVASDGVHRLSGYHGYWPIQPGGVDARLGGEAALRRLVEAAHARGVRVLLDAVINHVHGQHPYVSAHPDWFHSACVCGTPGCDWTELRLECLFRPYLPDINWENPQARAQFIADVVAQVERFDLDGVRFDAVKHVPDLAVRNLSVRLRERQEGAGTKFFLLGETAMGWDPTAGPSSGGNVDNYGVISRYLGPQGLDGQFDFPLYYAAALAFAQDAPGRGMAEVAAWTQASAAQYPAGAVMTPFLGSHDVPRFISLVSDPARAGNGWEDLPAAPDTDAPYDRMYAALGWLLSLPGMPLLYMGDEYGEFGGGDPDDRHAWRPPSQLSGREQRQLSRVAALAQARRALPGLRSHLSTTVYADPETWVVARGEGAQQVLVAIHRGGAATLQVPIPAAVAGEGTVFTDALPAGGSFTVSAGSLAFPVGPWSVRYLRRAVSR